MKLAPNSRGQAIRVGLLADAAEDAEAANGRKGLPPERLGAAVKHALTAARPKTRYTVTPDPFQNLLVTWLPKRAVDNLIARRLGLKRD